ncbi:hypothetical protein [Jannaschia sp. CCS1]|uniref:hypothetical protein n=1 Tax=Jannaschia sp. (strain CCS1) TaxID=290400 RepID=UPI000053C068|nr:hypothetical protein [Jannaschia sp. CCS1]ABD55457.1 hypothetical protein Jann_2540 [Jannaschia sp. CCS1]
MGDAYAVAMLVLYGGYTLILVVVAGLGLWLLRYRMMRWAGIAILAGLVAWCLIPPTLDRIAAAQERREIAAATALPEALSFEGQSVLIIEAGNTICSDFCGDIVQLGVPGDFYWLGMGSYTGGDTVPNPDFAILDATDRILRVQLGAPIEDMGGMRFAEPVEGAAIPDFDIVIIDDNGYLRSYAPQLLGLPDALVPRTQVARVLIEGWHDPMSDPPPAATYRSVAPWQDVGAFIYWPLSRNDAASPSIQQMTEAWTALICPNAGPPEARDAFTYAYLCDQSRLDEVLGGDG